MTHQRLAQVQHPKLYALGQHGIMKMLGSLVWGRQSLRTAKRLRTPIPRDYAARMRSQVVYVSVYGGTVNL